jgi:hypothetical protein
MQRVLNSLGIISQALNHTHILYSGTLNDIRLFNANIKLWLLFDKPLSQR